MFWQLEPIQCTQLRNAKMTMELESDSRVGIHYLSHAFLLQTQMPWSEVVLCEWAFMLIRMLSISKDCPSKWYECALRWRVEDDWQMKPSTQSKAKLNWKIRDQRRKRWNLSHSTDLFMNSIITVTTARSLLKERAAISPSTNWFVQLWGRNTNFSQ